MKESSEEFEITSVVDMNVKTATKEIDKHYPDNLTYKGKEFFYNIYIESILRAAKED